MLLRTKAHEGWLGQNYLVPCETIHVLRRVSAVLEELQVRFSHVQDQQRLNGFVHPIMRPPRDPDEFALPHPQDDMINVGVQVNAS